MQDECPTKQSIRNFHLQHCVEVMDRVESDPGGAVGGSSNLCPNLSSFLPLPPIFCGFGFLSLHILESAISERQHPTLAKAISQNHPDEIYDPNVTPQLASPVPPPFYLSDSRLGDVPRKFARKKIYLYKCFSRRL